ncbi:Carboxypeptidase regulatory-like domain protein [Tepidimonas fonticaldi]|uniref:Carboxypeptidase regulatory-like domain protein n=1 Tax=Tepidimonas fonticaldi TaxID=1101373 RepID=A0A554XMP1_9BURK|nr:methylamine utilization protein [Tepidimonas fonticaldi]TSE37094.1 Carboxypeptidase regulatory-like domain protein [Tepidimonas fonticaldi]
MRGVFAGLAGLAAAMAVSAAELRVAVRDARGQPLPGAVVMLESPQASAAVRPMTGVEMVQRDKAFVPEVLVVTRGTAVAFPNHDTVRHHVYSLSPVKPFEIKLYAGTPANPVVFDRAGVALLGCNIHDHMVAWVVVADTPHHARADARGEARLHGVPPGGYALVVWHRDLPVGAAGVRRAVTLREGAPAVVEAVLTEVAR